MPARCSAASASTNVSGDFVRMVHVQHDRNRRARVAQQLDQFRGHALRDHDRQTRVDADAAHVRDCVEPVDQAAQRRVLQHQRVAAGQDHFADARVALDRRERRKRDRLLMIRVRKRAAKTVAAVHRARGRSDQQYAAPVFLDHAGCERRVASPSGSVGVTGARSRSAISGRT